MTTEWNYGPLADAKEETSLRNILMQCFNFPAPRWDVYTGHVGIENFRRVSRGGEVCGGLALFFMGQWFGGRSVPMAGVAAVGVPPQHRTRKVGFELMASTLREIRERGVPLSALYPATQALYRKAGYEQAGSRFLYSIRASKIPRDRGEIDSSPVDLTKLDALHDLYRRRAALSGGNLDRNEGIWKRVFTTPGGEPIYAYLFGVPRPEGYIVFTQRQAEARYDILIRDFVALTPAAARSIWSFLAGHRSMAGDVQWYGPAVDPLLALLPEQGERIQSTFRWMLRIVDVAKALEARGYPADAAAELHLEVKDEILPENAGRYVMSVSGGRARVERGGRGDLCLHASALATLYAGFLSPEDLAVLGWIEGPSGALAAAHLFDGPAPWMPDMF